VAVFCWTGLAELLSYFAHLPHSHLCTIPAGVPLEYGLLVCASPHALCNDTRSADGDKESVLPRADVRRRHGQAAAGIDGHRAVPTWPFGTACRAGPCRYLSCLSGPSCLTGRASFVFVPGLRPKARSVDHLTVSCQAGP